MKIRTEKEEILLIKKIESIFYRIQSQNAFKKQEKGILGSSLVLLEHLKGHQKDK